MKKCVIALTSGDPGGIGPEIILKTFRKHRLSSRCAYVLFGSSESFDLLAKKNGLFLKAIVLPEFDISKIKEGNLYFVDTVTEAQKYMPRNPFSIQPRKIACSNAAFAYAALKLAAKHAVRGEIQGIVTAPISKTAMRFIEPDFHGHTEFLAHHAKVKSFAMMFVSSKLKVTLVTIHEAVSRVSKLITKKAVLEKIRLTDQFLKKYFRLKNARLGVCALNPHGRETGPEDEREIRPAVTRAVKEKIKASGPYSADQLFFDAYEGRFDAVISMYHDQGLAPFKMIAFRDGVNVTLGLPFVRTSPDHGTAFDIAYQDKADPVSFQAALKLAEKLVLSAVRKK